MWRLLKCEKRKNARARNIKSRTRSAAASLPAREIERAGNEARPRHLDCTPVSFSERGGRGTCPAPGRAAASINLVNITHINPRLLFTAAR